MDAAAVIRVHLIQAQAIRVNPSYIFDRFCPKLIVTSRRLNVSVRIQELVI